MDKAAPLNKFCLGCSELKPAASFSPHVNTQDRLQTRCRACRNDYQREKTRASPVNWRKYYSADSRRSDKREYYLKNKQEIIDRAASWAKKNPEVMAARAMHRLALKGKATPSWADLDLIESFYKEAKRRGLETGEKWHVDHIVPLKSKLVCGLHVQQNLSVITASENIAKSNRIWPDMP